MERLQDAFLPLMVWLGFIGMVVFFACMYRWARRQKGAALAFGMLIQMFLPDPKAQKTIEWVAKAEQEEVEQQKEDDKLKGQSH